MNLAIIIPYFKIDFFEKTLDSLAQQTDKRFHVYIGDDASPNSPEELLEKYKDQFNYTYKRFNDNLGSISLTKQWERCIEMIKDEEWLMILGDDDELAINVVSEFHKNLSEISINSSLVRFSTQLIDENSQPISEIFFNPKLENSIDSYVRKLNGESRSSLSEYIFKKNTYSKYGFKDYKLAWSSDDRAMIDFPDKKPIYSINNANVSIRISNINITGNRDNLQIKIKSRLQSTKEILREYSSVLTLEQKKVFFHLFENQYYRLGENSLSDTFLLITYSIKYKGYSYAYNQLKSVLINWK